MIQRKGCGGPGMCGHQEWCGDGLCEGHPQNLYWPVHQKDGGHEVSSEVSVRIDAPEVSPEQACLWGIVAGYVALTGLFLFCVYLIAEGLK